MINRTLVLGLIFLVGCEGTLSGPRELINTMLDDAPKNGPTTSTEPTPWTPPTCTTARCVGASALPRITSLEYQNAVLDVLGVWADVRNLPADGAIAGAFFTNEQTTLKPEDTDRYADVASQVATGAWSVDGSGARPIDAVFARLGSVCTNHDASCARAMIRHLGLRLTRRPLPPDEEDNFVALFTWTITPATDAEFTTGGSGTVDEGLQAVLEALLQSPRFLYRPERGEPTEDPAVVKLTPHEVAARLASFIVRSVPDEELLDAAESGQLETPEQVEAQARRMLASADGDRVWWFFAQDWLSTRSIRDASVQNTQDAVGKWDASVARDLGYDVHQTFAYLARRDGRISTLLTSSGGVLQGDSLEWLVGATGSRGTWAESLPGRRGILTTPGVLIANGHAGFTRAHQRGLFVRSRLLCQTIPAPSASLASSIAAAQMREENAPSAPTARARLAAVTEGNATCASCHKLTNRVGYAFDGFDDLGRQRTTEVGTDGVSYSIDTSGVLEGFAGSPLVTDVDGAFAQGDELFTKLAGSSAVESCMARQFSRYALQREPRADDQPSIDQISARLAATDGDLREAIVSLVKTESFVSRRIPQ